MKIAVCYSGQERVFGKTFENHKRVFESFGEVHYFFHFWSPWSVWHNHNEVTFQNEEELREFLNKNFINKEIVIQEHLEFLDYASLKVHQGIFDTDYKFSSSVHPSGISQLYSIYISNKMKQEYERKNDMVFDCVVRIRSDVFFQNEIDIKKIDLSVINLIGFGNQANKYFTDNTICDIFAISNSENMNIYSSVYNNLNRIIDDNSKGLVRIIQEDIIGYNLRYYGFSPQSCYKNPLIHVEYYREFFSW